MVNQYLSSIKACLDNLHLKLNTNKTILQIFPASSTVIDLDIHVSNSSDVIKSSRVAKNLGFLVDVQLKFTEQVSQTIKSCSFQLKKISSFRNCMTRDTCKRLIGALVLSRLNFCASLYQLCRKKDKQRLQRLQNHAARIISKSGRHEHITPILKHLGWMKIENFIKYRILMITFKALKLETPLYLYQLLKRYQPPRQLRPRQQQLSTPKLHKCSTEGAFCHTAPVLFNSLPNNITESGTVLTFQNKLKNFLIQ